MVVGETLTIGCWLLAISEALTVGCWLLAIGEAVIKRQKPLRTVILNSFQDLTASLYLFFSADRC